MSDRRVNLAGLAVAILALVAAVVIGVAQLRSDSETPDRIGDAVADRLHNFSAEPAPAETAARSGWGPSGDARPILDWSNPAQRKGFLDGPHFNSIISTPQYGQEMSFLDARRKIDTEPGAYQNDFGNAAGVYVLRAYIENGANDFLDSAVGEARGTLFSIRILPGVASGSGITAYIKADNAIPAQIYDVVTLRNDNRAFDLEYIPGTARIYNGAHPEGLALGDEIVDDGVLIGYQGMDGRFAPGYKYEAIIEVEVEVIPA